MAGITSDANLLTNELRFEPFLFYAATNKLKHIVSFDNLIDRSRVQIPSSVSFQYVTSNRTIESVAQNKMSVLLKMALFAPDRWVRVTLSKNSYFHF